MQNFNGKHKLNYMNREIKNETKRIKIEMTGVVPEPPGFSVVVGSEEGCVAVGSVTVG